MVNKVSANSTTENVRKQPANRDGNRAGDFSAQLNDARGRFKKKQQESGGINHIPPGIFSLSSILYQKNDVETSTQVQFDSQLPDKSESLRGESLDDRAVSNNAKQEVAEKEAYQDVFSVFMSQIVRPEMLQPIQPELIIAIPPNVPFDVDKFSAEIAQKVNEVKGKFDEINIALKPKELGNVNLTIKIVDGKVNISIAVDAKQRELFDDNLAQLSENLESQNIAIGELSVSVNNGYGHNPFDDFYYENSEDVEVENRLSLQEKALAMYRFFTDNQVYHSV